MSWGPDAAVVAAQGLPSGLTPVEVSTMDHWRELLAAVREQGLTGLLLDAIEDGRVKVGDARLADTARAEAAAGHLEAMAAVLRLERMLVRTARVLEDAGVDVRVLKGPAVAHLDHGEPAHRSFRDLDLLVRPEDYDRTVRLLCRQGYARAFPEPRPGFDRRFGRGVSLVGPGGWSIDLHRTLAFGPYGVHIDLADLWARAERFPVGRRSFAALAREERFLHACYHAALGDRSPRLVPLRDVPQLLLSADLDLDRVRDLARRWSGEPVLALAVAEAWQVLDITARHPLAEWARHYRPTRREALTRALYRREGTGYALVSIVAVAALPSLRDRAAYLYALALPERHYLAGRHPGLVRRFGHAGRELRMLARRSAPVRTTDSGGDQ